MILVAGVALAAMSIGWILILLASRSSGVIPGEGLDLSAIILAAVSYLVPAIGYCAAATFGGRLITQARRPFP